MNEIIFEQVASFASVLKGSVNSFSHFGLQPLA